MTRAAMIMAMALAACSTSPPEAGGGGSGGSAATTTTSTGGGTPAPRVLHASFVPENEPGRGPALLRLFNDTGSERLSITLSDGEAFAFYGVDPDITTEYQPAALSQLIEEVAVSIHTIEDTCLRINLDTIAGAKALEPLHAYTLQVTLDEDGFAAALLEDEMPEPFSGLRALVTDPAAVGKPALATLEIGASGEVFVFEKIFDDNPGRYALLPTPIIDLESLAFTDTGGVVHQLPNVPELPLAPGYTVVIASKPAAEAVTSVALDAL